MTGKEINSILEKHPYYQQLTSEEKFNVLNIALTKFWAKHTQKTFHAVIKAGEVGNDGNITEDQTDIYALVQTSELSYGLSSYRAMERLGI